MNLNLDQGGASLLYYYFIEFEYPWLQLAALGLHPSAVLNDVFSTTFYSRNVFTVIKSIESLLPEFLIKNDCTYKVEMIFLSRRFLPKWTNEFYFTTMKPQGDLFLLVFWRKLKEISKSWSENLSHFGLERQLFIPFLRVQLNYIHCVAYV